MKAWQPIETAPRDGTEVIGYALYTYGDGLPPLAFGPWTMAFRGKEWVPSWDNREVIEYMSDFGTDLRELDLQPTHWQPVPAAPSVSQTASPNTDDKDAKP